MLIIIIIFFLNDESHIGPSETGQAERVMDKKLSTETMQMAELPDTAQSSDHFSMI